MVSELEPEIFQGLVVEFVNFQELESENFKEQEYKSEPLPLRIQSPHFECSDPPIAAVLCL